MTHRIALARYGAYLQAWVLDLPGCVVGGRDMEEVAQLLPVVIAEHIAWLGSHGEIVADHGAWSVTEEIDATVFVETGGEFCFAGEQASLTREALANLVTRMGYARADLLDTVRQIPDAVLDWTPPPTAFASFDAWAPEVRTMRDVVTHVLQLEAYYRDGLRDGPAGGIFEPVVGPEAERARTVALLTSIADADRGRLYRPVRPSRSVAEEWTVRKVLRRAIAHERAHTAEIVQRRTWLLLGVPQAAQR